MRLHLFETFCKTIKSIPAKGVFKVIELEQRMIERDLAFNRIRSIGAAASILNFCHFLKAMKIGADIFPSVLPVEHVPFYRETVERLVAAEELPANAKDRFDAIFSRGFFEAIAA